MTKRPCVSVVVVTYESRLHIGSCLDSLYATAAEWIAECVVADNHSSDGTPQWIRDHFPQVIVTMQTENIGYGRAVNRVAELCTGEYLLIVNPDVVMKSGALRELILFLDHRPEAAACGPKLVSPDGTFRYESRRGFPTPMNSFAYLAGFDRLFPNSWRLGGYQLRSLSPDYEAATDSLSGSCMMVRKSGFREVGGFDEDYFLFGEDIDLCWKLRHAGHEIWYIPSAVATHIKGASMRFAPGAAHREFYRSMLIYMDKRLAPYHSRPVMWAARVGVRIVAALNGKYRKLNNHRHTAESPVSQLQVSDG